jgi:hypothetical protein
MYLTVPGFALSEGKTMEDAVAFACKSGAI